MSNCGLVEFAITDGTVVIDLLASNKHGAGFGVRNYVPGRPQLKDGGIWQDSNTESGRQLVFGVDTNIVDVVTLVCAGGSQSQVIQAFEELDLLLQKMRAYWTTNWQQTPVYLRARAKGEVATRYALIHYAKYDEYFNPYGELFAGNGFKVCTEEFAFGIEHGLWLDLPPGQSESVPVTHRFNSGDPINESGSSFTTGQSMGLIVGNMDQAVGGLQVVFRDDGGNFSSNLLDGNPPYNLINSPPATNDAVYFGSTLPFFGLVFDFSSVIIGSHVWEFWNGSAWTSITVSGFAGSGPAVWAGGGGIRFARWSPSDLATWTKTTVGADETNRYWIRIRMTGNGTGTLTQANRHVYAPVASYVEVDDGEIVGTQGALARIDTKIWWPSAMNGDGPFVFMGLRSVDRGDSFVAQLNTGIGNPVGVSNGIIAPNGTLTTDPSAPGGSHVSATNLTSFSNVTAWRFDTTIANQYYGQFRLFVRLNTSDDTGASQIRYAAGVGNIFGGSFFAVNTGETKNIPTAPSSSNTSVLMDLGYVNFPLSNKALYTDELSGFTVVLQIIVPSSKTIKIYNIILLPVDEWVGEITGKTQSAGNQTPHIVMDGITNPKYMRSYIVEHSELEAIAAAKPFLHAGATQRLWFLFNTTETGSTAGRNQAILASVRLAKAQRNVSLRRFPL